MILKLVALGASVFMLSICSDLPAHPAAPKAKVELTGPPSATPTVSVVDPSPTPTPTPPPSVYIKTVPYTAQAPHGDWATHEDYCEAAATLMYVSYLQGDTRELIPPDEADARMTRIVQYERATFHQTHPDLTLEQIGMVAQNLFGRKPQVLPATLANVQQQIAQGHPVILPVMTHGAPGGQKLAPYYGYLDVYHVILVRGYVGDTLITNDAGFLVYGENYRYKWYWISAAVDAQMAKMRQGRVMLVLT